MYPHKTIVTQSWNGNREFVAFVADGYQLTLLYGTYESRGEFEREFPDQTFTFITMEQWIKEHL